MKSNVTLNSVDRELFGVRIRQNTKGYFLSLTDLQNAYEKARWQNGWNEKRISDIFSSKTTRERIYHLLFEREIIKTEISVFMEMIEKEGIISCLKGLGVYETKGKGPDKTVMCDPYIWTLIALELNPLLYAKVVIWITDSLVFDRVEAGSEFVPMNRAIKTVVLNPNYASYSIEINKRVFGQHQTGMRNLASAKELRMIADIEKFVIKAIEQGWIKSEKEILSTIKNY